MSKITIAEYIKIGKVGDIINGGFGEMRVEDIFCASIVVRKLSGPDGATQSAEQWNNLMWRIELINNSNKMNIKEKFLTSLKKEPEKSFRKAEITNGDDMLTSDGKEIFLSWLLQKHGMEFKKSVVDELLEEKKKEEKK